LKDLKFSKRWGKSCHQILKKTGKSWIKFSKMAAKKHQQILKKTGKSCHKVLLNFHSDLLILVLKNMLMEESILPDSCLDHNKTLALLDPSTY
jgi:hypothetical protein